jgi:hypothetical protein
MNDSVHAYPLHKPELEEEFYQEPPKEAYIQTGPSIDNTYQQIHYERDLQKRNQIQRQREEDEIRYQNYMQAQRFL